MRPSTGTYSPSLTASREEVIQSRHTAEAKNKLDLAIVYSNIVIKWENLEINSSHLLNTTNFRSCRSKLRRFYLGKLVQYYMHNKLVSYIENYVSTCCHIIILRKSMAQPGNTQQ